MILKKIIRKNASLKIIIFFTVIIISVIPFIIISLTQDGNVNFDNCYIEKVGNDGKTAKIMVYSEKIIMDLLHVGEKISLLTSGNNTGNILIKGVIVKDISIIENHSVDGNNKKNKSFRITIRVDDADKRTLKTGEKVTLRRAGIFSPLKRFF